MRNVYYKYSEKTGMYKRVYPNLRSRILTYLRNALWFVLLGVSGYFVTLLILGTPESADDLREENARLLSQYVVLSQRMDEAMEVMEDIRQRDDNLYRVMLDIERCRLMLFISEIKRKRFFGNELIKFITNLTVSCF